MTLVWRPGFQFDADASTYIEAVEAADTHALETGVRYAINDFVIGCKNDGIWDAIKASCILAGARTLNGALVPLVGTAPTPYFFVAGDYDRETGLAGNGSTKYLNSNRNGNADPQNNQHCSVFVSTAASGSGAGHGYIGAGALTNGTTNIVPWAGGPGLYMRSQSATTQIVGLITTTGFIGLSRNTSSNYFARIDNATSTITQGSQTPISNAFTVFSLGADYYANGRLAFYSIGESLDLAKLDTRVSNLMTAIGAAIP
jgi:hypothetical protein